MTTVNININRRKKAPQLAFLFTLIGLLSIAPLARAEDEPKGSKEEPLDPTADVDDEEDSQEVVILGTRSSQMAGAVTVIGKKQLERFEDDDPHAALRQVPGVFVREEDGIGLRPNIAMRGANPDRSKKVTLMEDGVLFGPAPYSAPAAYYFPLMTRMTQIRVIKGPSAIAYGPQTVGGAIDLVTRSIPASPKLGADLAYGQYGYRKAHVYAGASTEKLGILIEGVHLGNDGFKELPDGQNTGSARNEWMVKASYVPDPSARVFQEFRVKLGYSTEASNETYLGLSDEDFEENPNRRYPSSALDRMDNHRTSAVLSYELKDAEEGIEVLATAYRNDFSRVWRKFNRLGGTAAGPVLANPDDPAYASYYAVLSGSANTSSDLDTLWIGPNSRQFVSHGGFVRFRAQPVTGAVSHRFETGIRMHYDSIERDHSESAYAMVDGELVAAGEPTITTTRNFAATKALALHMTDAMTYRALTVTPGIRVEGVFSNLDDYLENDSVQRTTLAVLPGLGAYYALTPDWGILAGAYRGFSPPAPGSDSSIQPEYSINYEVGSRYISRPTHLEVIGFFNDYSNLTDICTFSNGCLDADLDRQFDAGHAFIYGLEAMAAHTVTAGAHHFPFTASYSLTFSEFRSDFNSADPVYGAVEKGDELPFVPRHQVNASLAWNYERFETFVRGTYVSAMREQAGHDPLDDVQSTDPLVTLDIGGSARVFDHFRVYLNVRNLLDYQQVMAHLPFGARPNAPRWIQGGIKAEF